MNPCFESLKAHIKANPPNFGDGESALTIYTDLKLNPGNLNAWLKHGDSDKVSLETARRTLRYVEAYGVQPRVQ